MNRRLLARQMAAQVDGLSVQMAGAAIDAFCESVSQTLATNESVTLSDFGTFGVRYRQSRQTFHPRTRQPVTIPAALVPTFTPSPALRTRIQPPSNDDAASAPLDAADVDAASTDD